MEVLDEACVHVTLEGVLAVGPSASAEPDPDADANMLFASYQIEVDLPAENSELDIEVPRQRR